MNHFFIQFHYGHTPFSLVISYCKHTEWSYCINASVTHIIIMYLLHDCCTCAFVYCMYTKLLTSRTYRENSYVIFILYRPPIYIQQLCSCITAGCIHNCNYKLDSFIIDLTIKLIGSGVGAIYIHMRNRSWLFPVFNYCSLMVLKFLTDSSHTNVFCWCTRTVGALPLQGLHFPPPTSTSTAHWGSWDPFI